MNRPGDADQAFFARALLDRARACPAGLRSWNASDPAQRFAVYRNNVVVSLIEALADTYPVVREVVGAEFFTAMARLFATRHPPAHPVLAFYGGGFAAFIKGFEPARSVPWLADVARLEWLRVQAFHAADAAAIDSAPWFSRTAADPGVLAASSLRLHPSVGVLVSAWAVVSLWGAHQGAGELAQVDPQQAECALVLRAADGVLAIAVAPATAQFITRLAAGTTLAHAAAVGGEFDLAGSLALLIRHGAIVAWHPPRSLWP